jgi:uncharacterized membrane protein YeiH
MRKQRIRRKGYANSIAKYLAWDNIMKLILFIEIIGTVAFAISGAFLAINKDMDYFGITVLAITTAVGGGMIRDIIISKSLPASLTNPIYIGISIFTAISVILFYNKNIRLGKVLQFFDAIGLGAFTAIGAEVAIQNGFYQPSVVITLALLTGTGGGVLRDVFAKEIPSVFSKEIYSIASIIGAIFFIIIHKFMGNEAAALYACFVITTLIRLYCMVNNIQLRKVLKIRN